MIYRSCPRCNFAIEFLCVDGEAVICPTCDLDCEIHMGLATDLLTGEEQKVILLEPLNKLHSGGFLPLETD